jgi:post-segregation antitoxin (ccd killing protein)
MTTQPCNCDAQRCCGGAKRWQESNSPSCASVNMHIFAADNTAVQLRCADVLRGAKRWQKSNSPCCASVNMHIFAASAAIAKRLRSDEKAMIKRWESDGMAMRKRFHSDCAAMGKRLRSSTILIATTLFHLQNISKLTGWSWNGKSRT